MAKNDAQYWKNRFIQLEDALHKQGASYFSTLDTEFAMAQKEIEEKISAWYQRFAKNNEVTMDYKNTGKPAVYDSHQEISLELFEGWA